MLARHRILPQTLPNVLTADTERISVKQFSLRRTSGFGGFQRALAELTHSMYFRENDPI